MKRARIAALFLGGIAATTLGASGLAVAKQATIKEMMGENFAGLQTLLIALVTSNYETVPGHVDRIREHATLLDADGPGQREGRSGSVSRLRLQLASPRGGREVDRRRCSLSETRP
jgi:hypothetical protein